MFSRYLKKYKDKLSHNDGDPIEAAKKMVSFIQQLVGIHNVFGDKDRKYSALTIFYAILFGGSFIYIGTCSQSVYLLQVIPNKLETFKAMNCLSATCVPLTKYIFMWTSRKFLYDGVVLLYGYSITSYLTQANSLVTLVPYNWHYGKSFILSTYKNNLRTIMEMSRQGLTSLPENSKAHTKMLNTLQRARYISWLVVVNQVATHIIYLIMPFLLTVFGNERYLPSTPGEPYGLNPKYETPFYEITFIITCLATAFSAVNQTGYIVLFVTLLAHEIGHIYAITETLNHIYETLADDDKSIMLVNNITKKEKEVESMLSLCIKHYQFLIQYHSKIRNLYKVIFGAHFVIMIIVLVTTLQTMYAWDIRNSILTGVTGVMPLFIYCFGGEMLISAGLEMSQAIYSCGWQFLPAKQAKVVLLMLCLSQRPLYLTAADFFIMNRETFGDIAQFIYKIYAVFN